MRKCLPYIHSLLFTCLLASHVLAAGKPASREFFQLVVYRYNNSQQEGVLDHYLKQALLPALHRMKIENVGVFKAIANDTSAQKVLYVLIPLRTVEKVVDIHAKLAKDAEYQSAGKEYIDAVYTSPPYARMESILLQAFPLAPKMQLPQLTGEKKGQGL
jgi:hypothetical protein